MYEARSLFEAAEKAYLQAGLSGCIDVRQQALAGLNRVQDRTKDADLSLGLFYESQGSWSEAEEHYAKAVDHTPSSEERKAALEGLWRVKQRQHPSVHRIINFTDFLYSWVAIAGRGLGLLLLASIVLGFVFAIRANYQAMVVDRHF
jgi:tetratricopeptide (TPR) repeat protein